METLDHRTLANIRKCKAPGGYLDGAGCTNSCEIRDSCRIARIPLMVGSHNFKTKSVGVHIILSEYANSWETVSHNIEEYINEFSGAIG